MIYVLAYQADRLPRKTMIASEKRIQPLSPIAHEESNRRGAFFIELDGERLAKMTYNRVGAALVIIDHTKVDRMLAGQGVGRRLLDAAVAWARATSTKIIATCPFARAKFAADPSIRDVLAPKGTAHQ